MTAKTRAIPSLHRDSKLAKVYGHCPDAASGNTTSPYCRAVSKNEPAQTEIGLAPPLDSFVIK